MAYNEDLSITTSSVGYDNLFVTGAMDTVTDKVIIKAGNNLKRGTVLGILTAGGQAVAVDSSKSDGSQVAYSILATDTDATAGDKVSTHYLTGEYNANALIYGGTDTNATHKSSLRKIGIFIKNAVKA